MDPLAYSVDLLDFDLSDAQQFTIKVEEPVQQSYAEFVLNGEGLSDSDHEALDLAVLAKYSQVPLTF